MSEVISDTQNVTVQIARSWIGTPYIHQHTTKDHGTDCLGLIRGIWRELYGKEPTKVSAYTPDWSEVSHREELWDAASKFMNEIPINLNITGTVLLFRMRSGSVAKHVGLLASSAQNFPTLIHAYSGHGVVETPLTQAWVRRIVAQYSFPNKVN